MDGSLSSRKAGDVEESRRLIYDFLAALLTHPDKGEWGRVLNGQAQRSVIAAADMLRSAARAMAYPLRDLDLGTDQLDLRYLVLELCQPLEHLKAEYQRVFCDPRPPRSMSPYELDHHDGVGDYRLVEATADLTTWFRAFGFVGSGPVPARPDHLACELNFMNHLLTQRRREERLVQVDQQADRYATSCDLAQRRFFGDHLANWVVSFATGLRACPSGGFLAPLGWFLAAWIPLERFYLEMPEEHLDLSSSTEGFAVGH